MASVLEQAMEHAAGYEARLKAENKQFGEPLAHWLETKAGQTWVVEANGRQHGPYLQVENATKKLYELEYGGSN